MPPDNLPHRLLQQHCAAHPPIIRQPTTPSARDYLLTIIDHCGSIIRQERHSGTRTQARKRALRVLSWETARDLHGKYRPTYMVIVATLRTARFAYVKDADGIEQHPHYYNPDW